MNHEDMNKLLKPKSIAVVGASATPGKIGYTVLENLQKSGYQGPVYPINPTATEILGMKCYASLADVPGSIDAAVMCVPVKLVNTCAEDCGKKGVKGLIVITSGFSEVGRKDLEDELVATAKKYNMRVLGPNIVGTLSNSDKMNASFAPFLPLDGKATLVTQSGALLIAMDAATYTRRVGFDKMVSIGNMCDVDIADIIDWLNDDPNSTCTSLYIEGFERWPQVHQIRPRFQKTDHCPEIRRFRPRRCRRGFPHRFTGRRCQSVRFRLQTGWRYSGFRP